MNKFAIYFKIEIEADSEEEIRDSLLNGNFVEEYNLDADNIEIIKIKGKQNEI